MEKGLVSLAILLAVWHLALATGLITQEDLGDEVKFTCMKGKWAQNNMTDLSLPYKDDKSGEYWCVEMEKKTAVIYVKFRTCENCIELDPSTLGGLVCGDLVATLLIGVAVYLIASQPRGRTYGSTNSKASDRQNLIPNQPNDTYMPLTQGQSSEYSRLERRGNRK